MRVLLLTFLAMVAFAANSLLCRMALGDGQIDAASFTAARLLSGAVILLFIVRWKSKRKDAHAGSWRAALMLFVYAAAFSFAYLELRVGTGALILFGSVQVTMILAGIAAGERPRMLDWGGFISAAAGLVYLVLPGIAAPPLVASFLMAVAGVAWGVYSLLGRSSRNATASTAENFARAAILSIPLYFLMKNGGMITGQGLMLAVVSGAVTSGLGYVIWYAALRGLTATQAAVVQLSVPVLAAAGGVVFLHEEVTLRLAVAATAIIGGVGVVLAGRSRSGSTKFPLPVKDTADKV